MRALSLIFLMTFMVLATSCRDGDTPAAQANPTQETPGTTDGGGGLEPGGSDGGGGTAGTSTEEQIKEAIKEAFEIAKDPRWGSYLKSQRHPDPQGFLNIYLSEEEVAYNEPFNIIFNIVDPETYYFETEMGIDLGCQFDCDEYHERKNRIREEAKKLKDETYFNRVNGRVYFEEKDYCPANDKDNADASVEYNNKDAAICFSLFSLKRIPPESLGAHVLGLLFHELSHMFGHEEDMAKRIERIALAAHPFFKSDKKVRIVEAISKIAGRFKKMREQIDDQITYYQFNKFGGSHIHSSGLKRLHDFMTNLASLKSLSENLLILMESYPSEVCSGLNFKEPHLVDYPEGSIQEGSVEGRLREIVAAVDQINEGYLSYLDDPSNRFFDEINILRTYKIKMYWLKSCRE